MYNIEKALEKFNNLPADIILEVDSQRVADRVAELEEKYEMINLGAVIILVAVGDLRKEEIPQYLIMEYGISKLAAEQAAKDLWNDIFSPLLDRLHFFDSDPGKTSLTFKQEKEVALKIFREDLVYDLTNNPIIINIINSRIFYILSRELKFKKDLENALYKNLTKLTHKKFVLAGKLHAPSVRNWLNDFIKHYGTDMFSNVVLSDYVINSENAGRLDEAEKELVRKLLLLYRNLKFFPESMPSDDGRDWEIIPIEEDGELSKARRVAEPPKSKEEEGIEELRNIAAQYDAGSLERAAVEERIAAEFKKIKKLKELKATADHYKEDSLERKAIEEEIEKIKS